MTVPATKGQLRDKIVDMEIGDYIYGNLEVNVGWGIGTQKGTEVPFTGIKNGETSIHYFYYIKVAPGILVSDRVVLHSISYDSLNSVSDVIEGRKEDAARYTGVEGILRSLKGGVAYSDSKGAKLLSTTGAVAAWPANNEWDRYILNFDSTLIEDGKTIGDVFHLDLWTICQDTTHVAIVTGIDGKSRVARGKNGPSAFGWANSDYVAVDMGFRPVFEYKEV